MSQLTQEEPQPIDLSETLSKVESIVLQNAKSKFLETPSSKLGGNIFSRATRFKKKLNDQSQTTFLDEGGERSLDTSGMESQSVFKVINKHNKF